MKLLRVPRLTVLEYQSFTSQVIEICVALVVLQVPLSVVQSLFESYKKAMSKHGSLARKIGDNRRDIPYRRSIDLLHIERDFSEHPESIVRIIQSVLDIYEIYGGKQVTRMGFDQETTIIDNIVREISSIDLTPLTESGIAFERWYNLMVVRNDEFKALTNSVLTAEALQSNLNSASAQIPELTTALNHLFDVVFAQGTINPSDELILVHKKLEELIKHY